MSVAVVAYFKCLVVLSFINTSPFFLEIYLFERERVHGHELGEGEGEREFQADSMLSTGLNLTTLISWPLRSRPEPEPGVGGLTN